MTRTQAMAKVAQLIINIDTGLTTVEKDSPIYRALVWLVHEEIKTRKAS